MYKIIFTLSLVICSFISNSQTVGLTSYSNNTELDFVLFSPNGSTNTFLINNCGEMVNEWSSSYKPGMSVYLLPNGNLMRTGKLNNSLFPNAAGRGGVIEIYDWNGNLIWDYFIYNGTEFQHHDVAYLPNGNILAIAWDRKSMVEADIAGRDTNTVDVSFWSEKIIEIQPNYINNSGTIVWEWYLWDHLIQDNNASKNNFGIVSDFPELVDVNFPVTAQPKSDWAHINGIDYNASLDQIVLSSHSLSELWVIDHSTTTAEAASHSGGDSGKGGDLLYRWGNPLAYQRGTVTDQKLFKQHQVDWIDDTLIDGGKMIVFNNQVGVGDPNGDYSSVDIVIPDMDINGNYILATGQKYGPLSEFWRYTSNPTSNFYSSNISGASRINDGHTLICEGTSGHFFELNQNDSIIWEYVNPMSSIGMLSQGDTPQNNATFRCTNYPSNYSGLTGSLVSQGPLELNPSVSLCSVTAVETKQNVKSFNIYPNPVNNMLTIISELGIGDMVLYNSIGEKMYMNTINKELIIDVNDFPRGIYYITFISEKGKHSKKIIVN